MPGVDLNLDLPVLSDNLATIVAKLTTAISAIEDDLAAKVVPAEINVNAAMSFNGFALSGLGSVTLVSGNVPTAAGSIYYSAGEFYAIDATSTVKLTNAGQIAVAGVKGIGGDYGNPANSALVYYDNASGEYRFFAGNGTTPAPVVVGSTNLKNTSGFTTTVKPSASAASSFTVTWPTALPAATRPVTMSSTGQLSTAVQTFTLSIPGGLGQGQNGATWTANGPVWTATSVSCNVYYPVQLPVGAVITGYKLWIRKTSAAGSVATQLQSDNGATGATVTLSPGTGTEINSANNPGYVQLSATGLSYTVVSGSAVSIHLSNGANTGDQAFHAEVTYTF